MSRLSLRSVPRAFRLSGVPGRIANQWRGRRKGANQVRAGARRIAYVVSRFPKLTETFIYHEILEMQRRGVHVQLYPLLRHVEPVTQPEIDRVRPHVRFVRFTSLAMVRAHSHFLAHRPRAYFGVLREVLWGTRKSVRAFAGATWFFPRAVCCAYDVERTGIEHVHAQFAYHAAVAALVMHRLTGIPFSFSARGTDIHVDRTMLREKLEAAEFAIAVSESNRDVLLESGGRGVAGKVHVVYGGIDVDRFRPPAPRARDQKWRILCVARFEEVKGHKYLVDACEALNARGVDFECHLVGDGELREVVEDQVRAMALGERVFFHGARTQPEVLDHLARADVFVLAGVPSSEGKREGIPNVLKEAMACGVPVVASRMGGIPELVENGETGLLVAPRDVTALTETLQLLHRDRELCARLGQAARSRILDRFTLRASTRKRAELFFGPAPRSGAAGVYLP